MYYSSKTYKFVALLFLLIVLGLAIAIVHFSFSRATIIVTAEKENITASLTTNINLPALQDNAAVPEEAKDLREAILSEPEQVASPFIENNLPGEILDVTVEAEKSFTPEGPTKEIIGHASGNVTIKNTGTTNQPLVRRTRLLAPNGNIFRTQEGVTVPANGEVTVTAVADAEGPEGDIAAATALTIPGLAEARQKVVFAKNREAFTGGITRVAVVSNTDIQNAHATLTKELEEKGFQELLRKDPNIERTALSSDVIAFSRDADAGQEKDAFLVKGAMKVRAITFDRDALKEATIKKLEVSLPSDKSLLNVDEDSFTYEIKDFQKAQGRAIVESSVNGSMVVKEGNMLIQKKNLIGKTAKEIQDLFLEQSSVSAVVVTFWPFWVKKTPRIEEHIDVIIQSPKQGEQTTVDNPKQPNNQKRDLRSEYIAP